MDLQLRGDTALVTASSSGLGKASARSLAAAGVNVVLNGRNEDRLNTAIAEIRNDAEASVVGQPADLTNPEEVVILVERTIEEFGSLDHLIVSTGGPERRRFRNATDEEWYAAFDLLVMSVVWLVRSSADSLRTNGGGTIVLITSTATKEPNPANIFSSSIRTAVLGLGKTLSRELAPEVRVNSVLPGAHDTPRIRENITNTTIDRDAFDTVHNMLGEEGRTERIGDPEDFGTIVAFLCSPRAGYVNGTAIQIDGGVSSGTF